METQGINLFIVDDNRLMVADLKYYLKNRFGNAINVSTFDDGESCLINLKKDTHIVILDYHMEGKNGLETLKLIKEKNPKTEVIILSRNEDIAIAIETFRQGAKDYVIKGQGAWKKVTKLINLIITEPIRIIVREFGITKFAAIFLLTFVTMGVVVFFVTQAMR